MAQTLICPNCGYIGKSTKKYKGNLLIEIILWLFFIIPGLIYSIWRGSSGYNSCPSCGNSNMIPTSSPVGLKLLKDQGKTPEQFQDNSKQISLPSIKGKTVMIILGICLSIIFMTAYFSK